MPKEKTSKSKKTGQYDRDVDTEKVNKEASEAVLEATKNVVIPSSNSTCIGQLYINDGGDETKSRIVYVGKVPYTISEKVKPVEDFYHYFKTVMNNVCGFIEEKNISLDVIKTDPATAACHLFLSMLYYNNIVIPHKIKLLKFDSPIVLGECIYYTKKYEHNELNVCVSNQLIQNLFYKDFSHDINFSRRINNEQYSLKNDIMEASSSIVVSQEMYKCLVILFVICDHAATHFIEEFMTGDTDWINHQNFGKCVSNMVTTNSIFDISAQVQISKIMPKFSAEINRLSDIDSFGVSTSSSSGFTNFNMDSSGMPGDIAPINDLLNMTF
ncbi:hypothetical protein PvNV_053 [Penaeus vannamei nudivirus]|nr:hypothetical protein PvSNPV_053 [Penaeus vannamei nucleopolyhedrovirus]